MLNVIDTATSQQNLVFGIPFGEGFHDCYVKVGGDNVDTYTSPFYKVQVDRAYAAGFLHVGHYWVPDANPDDPDTVDTPMQQADWMVDRLYRWDRTAGFVVLDNEDLDGALRFDDVQAAAFVERTKARLRIPGEQVYFYTNLNDARAHGWPLLLATGAQVIIAAPSYPPGALPIIPTIPADRIVGHQYGTRSFGGVVTDVNVFWDHAFDYAGGGIVPLSNYVLRPPATVILDDARDPYVSWQHHLERTGRGGVDIVAAVGTPVYARTAGVMLHIPDDGSAGNSCRFHHDANPGWKDVFSHLSSYVGESGRHFEAGEIVAYTGNTGGVTQHLHWHLLDPSGVRRNPWDYFSGSATAGGGFEEIDMPLDSNDKAWLNGLGAAIIEQVLGYGSGAANNATVGKQIALVRADLNTLHVASPYSLKAIREAQTTGGIDVDALAAKIASLIVIPAGSGVTEAQVEAAVRRVFLDASA